MVVRGMAAGAGRLSCMLPGVAPPEQAQEAGGRVPRSATW
jgi:hypothetical protein